MWIFYFCFFFFQAEDGIRDRDVTGVQTCALPISTRMVCIVSHGFLTAPWTPPVTVPASPPAVAMGASGFGRSEERRVGKECRSRGVPDCERKKRWKYCIIDGTR